MKLLPNTENSAHLAMTTVSKTLQKKNIIIKWEYICKINLVYTMGAIIKVIKI